MPGLLFSSEHVPQLSINELVKWPLYFFAYYTVLQMKNARRRTFAINPGHNRKLGRFLLNLGKPSHGATMNQHLVLSAKINGTQNR